MCGPEGMASQMAWEQRVALSVSYDPSTGLFARVLGGKGSRPGPLLGFLTHDGYREVRVCGRRITLHRLAFVCMGFAVPEAVDHANRDRSDNSWGNLRPATAQGDRNNQTALGVTRYHRRWAARHQRRVVYRGPCFGKAVTAYQAAKAKTINACFPA